MPMRRAVRITRTAISPRLAIRIFLNMSVPPVGGGDKAELRPSLPLFLRLRDRLSTPPAEQSEHGALRVHGLDDPAAAGYLHRPVHHLAAVVGDALRRG